MGNHYLDPFRLTLLPIPHSRWPPVPWGGWAFSNGTCNRHLFLWLIFVEYHCIYIYTLYMGVSYNDSHAVTMGVSWVVDHSNYPGFLFMKLLGSQPFFSTTPILATYLGNILNDSILINTSTSWNAENHSLVDFDDFDMLWFLGCYQITRRSHHFELGIIVGMHRVWKSHPKRHFFLCRQV